MKIEDRLCQDVFTQEMMTHLDIPKHIQSKIRHLFEIEFGEYYSYTIKDFLQVGPRALCRTKNLGTVTIKAIHVVLRHYGLPEFKVVEKCGKYF